MRKLGLALLVIAFAGACAHKQTAPTTDGKPADSSPAPTKDQSTPTKKKHKKAAAAATAGAVKCTHGQDERLIEVKDKDGGCETIYTKMGEAKSIATSGHGQEHCKEVSSKIQEHLTGAGFSCQ